MLFEPKNAVLKDGRTAVLRPPEVADAPELLDYLIRVNGETPFLLSYPEELANTTVAWEAEFLQTRRTSPDVYMVVCEVDGKIAGLFTLSRQSRLKTRHRAELSIALLLNYWGLGLGTALFQDGIAKARELGVTQLELEVDDANQRGIALYQKMGFRIVGTIPNAVILKDGRVFSSHIMVRKV